MYLEESPVIVQRGTWTGGGGGSLVRHMVLTAVLELRADMKGLQYRKGTDMVVRYFVDVT